MIRAREREGSDEGEEWIGTGRPEDSRISNPQSFAREDVVRPQITRGTPEGRGWEAIEKIRRVEGRVAYV